LTGWNLRSPNARRGNREIPVFESLIPDNRGLLVSLKKKKKLMLSLIHNSIVEHHFISFLIQSKGHLKYLSSKHQALSSNAKKQKKKLFKPAHL
jgi:hypothetical protein